MQAKKWYLSKVLWTNVVVILISLVTTLITQNIIAPTVGAAVLAIANVVLRLLTNQPIEGTPGAKAIK